MFERFKYHILLHIIIFVWGFTGILGVLIHLEAFVLVWFRVLIAFVSLLLFLLILRRPILIKNKKHLLATLGIGLLVAAHWITFYVSIQLSTASLGILCLSTATIHVTWLDPLVMKRRFSWKQFILGLIVIYGIYFVSHDFSAQDYEALCYGLVSALCAASFNVLNGKMSHYVPSSSLTVYEMGIGIIAIGIALFFQGKINADLFVMRWEDLAWLLFLGIICTSVAFLLTIDLTRRLGAFTVTLSINLEPVYTMILAIIILHENKLLSSQFYIGSAIIILVVVANGVLKYLETKREKLS